MIQVLHSVTEPVPPTVVIENPAVPPALGPIEKLNVPSPPNAILLTVNVPGVTWTAVLVNVNVPVPPAGIKTDWNNPPVVNSITVYNPVGRSGIIKEPDPPVTEILSNLVGGLIIKLNKPVSPPIVTLLITNVPCVVLVTLLITNVPRVVLVNVAVTIPAGWTSTTTCEVPDQPSGSICVFV